jgi:hypothetical protein
MTESPRRNILLMNRSLFTGLAFFFPFPVFGTSVHISLTFSRTILQWRSKAFTRPSNFLLFRQLMSTWVLFLTDIVSTERGPVENSSSSVFSVSSSIGLAPLMVTVQASPPSLQSSCNSDDLKEKENEGGRRRRRNRYSKKLEIAQAAKTRNLPRKKTRGTQKTQERRLGFWMGLWNSGM